MDEEYRRLLSERFRLLSEKDGETKVMNLGEAVREFVKPGMAIFFELNQSIRSNVGLYELVRQFHGKDPQFELIIGGMGSNAIVLLHSGIIKKIITAFVGEGFPFPGPNKRFQKMYRDKEIEIENWSILSIPRRLMAGALGVGFMPTRSIEGSDMAKENSDSFKLIDDPFKPGEKVAVLKPLNPDISFVHGIAADKFGNTILTSPLGDGGYGMMASKSGVIVTVEKIVSPDVIRRYSHMVKVPGNIVRSVSETPMGAHPFSVSNHGIEELPVAYAEDNDFFLEVRDASKDPDTLEAWMQEWVIDPGDHEGFLKKLGYEKIMFLKGKAQPDSWKYELDHVWEKVPQTDDYNDTEWMIVVVARKIREKVIANDYQNVLAGVGASNLAAWLAYYELKDEGKIINLMAEIGLFGYEPRPSDPFIFNSRNLPTSRMLSDTDTILSVHAAGGLNKCMGILGAVHVDKHGNLNTTKIPDKDLFFMGSGGANDVASGAQEVLVAVNQDKNRYVEKAPYITTPGKNIKTAVSNMGVFEKLDGGDELILTGYFTKNSGVDKDDIVQKIKDNCGWDVKVADDLEAIGPPTSKELKTIRLCDPRGYFLGRRT